MKLLTGLMRPYISTKFRKTAFNIVHGICRETATNKGKTQTSENEVTRHAKKLRPHDDLSSCTRVFLRNDAVRVPLLATYTSPKVEWKKRFDRQIQTGVDDKRRSIVLSMFQWPVVRHANSWAWRYWIA